ncbi:uncharacterized protein [Linepithema humile]|uniref:uncharacterized protein isoform X4 n=1 Tax=Linepithema humile TaxID=83485 RepID=UPI00351EE107
MAKVHYFLIKRNQKHYVCTSKEKKINDIIIARHENCVILKSIANNLNIRVPYIYIRKLIRQTDKATHFKRQLPIITEEKVLPSKLRIKIVKKKLCANHNKDNDQVKVLNNNYQKHKSKMKIKDVTKIEEIKVNSDNNKQNYSRRINNLQDGSRMNL